MPSRRRGSSGRLPTYIYSGAVEGDQELEYFNHVKNLVEIGQTCKVVFNFNVVPKSKYEIARAAHSRSNFKKGAVAVFDFDIKVEDFEKALEYCHNNSMYSAYSNMSFDLWLILHKCNYRSCVHAPKGYLSKLRKEFEIDNNDDIKTAKNIKRIVSQITIEDIKDAIIRAEAIEIKNKSCGEINNVPGCGEIYYNNPCLKIHEFVKQVLEDTGLYMNPN